MTTHNKDKLQKIQNKALRYALEERFPYRRNTETLYEIANVEPINFYLYKQAQEIFTKLTNLNIDKFMYLMDNYDGEQDHSYYPKTRNKLERGAPEKRYATR